MREKLRHFLFSQFTYIGQSRKRNFVYKQFIYPFVESVVFTDELLSFYDQSSEIVIVGSGDVGG